MKIRAQIAMVLNLDKCIGCHTCSVTCKNVWTSREGMEYAWFNNVETKPGIGYPKEWENQDKCIGCRYCMIACPFQVPRFEWRRAMPAIQKCNMCAERQRTGAQPASPVSTMDRSSEYFFAGATSLAEQLDSASSLPRGALTTTGAIRLGP